MKEEAGVKEGKPMGRDARQKRKARSKAFDAVLEREDIEGPIVITSAGHNGTHILLPTSLGSIC